jgi:peptide/nickel transport system ATP-binding protein
MTMFGAPEHPYTWGLLRSIPRMTAPREIDLVPIPGRPPSLINRPSGCSFHPRCPYVRPAHTKIDPQLEPTSDVPAHSVACLLDQATRRKLWRELHRPALPVATAPAAPEDEATA